MTKFINSQLAMEAFDSINILESNELETVEINEGAIVQLHSDALCSFQDIEGVLLQRLSRIDELNSPSDVENKAQKTVKLIAFNSSVNENETLILDINLNLN